MLFSWQAILMPAASSQIASASTYNLGTFACAEFNSLWRTWLTAPMTFRTRAWDAPEGQQCSFMILCTTDFPFLRSVWRRGEHWMPQFLTKSLSINLFVTCVLCWTASFAFQPMPRSLFFTCKGGLCVCARSCREFTTAELKPACEQLCESMLIPSQRIGCCTKLKFDSKQGGGSWRRRLVEILLP